MERSLEDADFAVTSADRPVEEGERHDPLWWNMTDPYRRILNDPSSSAIERDRALISLSSYARSAADARELEPYFERRFTLPSVSLPNVAGGERDHASQPTEQALAVARAEIYCLVAKPELAIWCLEACLEQLLAAGGSRHDFVGRTTLVRCYRQTGQLEKAYGFYGKACGDLALQPTQRVNMLLEWSRLQEDESLLSEALATAQQADSVAARALAEDQQGPERAETPREQLLQVQRDSESRVVDCLLRLERRAEALHFAERCVADAQAYGSAGRELDALALLFRIQQDSSEQERGLQTLKQMLTLARARVPERQAELQLSLAAAYADCGSADEACALFADLAESDPERHGRVIVRQLSLAVDRAQARADFHCMQVLAAALHRLAKQLGDPPFELRAHAFLASAFMGRSRWEDAKAVLADGIACAESHEQAEAAAELSDFYSHVCDSIEQLDRACASLEKCIADIPLYSQEELEQMVTAMVNMSKSELPPHTHLRAEGLCLQCIAQCLLRLGHEGDAREAAQAALARFAESADHERASRLRLRLASLLRSPGGE